MSWSRRRGDRWYFGEGFTEQRTNTRVFFYDRPGRIKGESKRKKVTTSVTRGGEKEELTHPKIHRSSLQGGEK